MRRRLVPFEFLRHIDAAWLSCFWRAPLGSGPAVIVRMNCRRRQTHLIFIRSPVSRVLLSPSIVDVIVQLCELRAAKSILL